MKVTLLALSVTAACLPAMSQAREYTFDPSMLGEAGKSASIELLSQGGQLPGTYPVDILLNGDRVDSRDVQFTTEKGGRGDLKPCLTVDQLSRYGIRTEKYPALSGGACADPEVIPDAKVTYQFYNQQLLLSIPQVALRPKLSGIAPQALWDDGIPALLMDYSANVSRTENTGGGDNRNNNSAYAQLNPGANLGAWRLRNQTNWTRQGDGSSKWQTVYTYADRGLYDWKSRLTLGDRATPGDVFDGVPFRGVMLGSDENMVPYNQREYAPVVRGIARTQARVEVKQNGYTVYSQVVAPGPFALTDMNVSGSNSGGDLQVTVYETDGSTQVFTVPYQSPAIALHEGYMKYNVMAGRYRPASSGTGGTVGQATVMYGLPWNLTVYGGGQAAEHYQAASLGLGVSMGEWGALSLDGTGSRGQRQHQDTEQGGAWRLRYSKNVVSTNTTLSMTSYQYASAGYNTLSDVMDTWTNEDGNQWRSYNPSDRRKAISSLTLNQSAGSWGTLGLSGTRTTYWNRPGHDDTYGASYGFGVYGASVTLGLSRTRQYSSNGQSRDDNTGSVFVSVPLSRLLGGGSSMNATYQLVSSKDSTSNEAGLNGWGLGRQLNWDVRERFRSGGTGDRDTSSARLAWYGRYGQIGGNYSYSPHQRQMGANVSGGMLVHQHGVTLGQSLGDTVALVSAPGASGVPVGGYPGVSTDFRGYTTKGWLSPYQENTISLDPTRLPADAEIQQTDVKVVPTQGAVIPAAFATRVGERALMTLTRQGGELLPFGAVVTPDGQNGGAGVVGDGGQVYLSGLTPQGTLSAQWGAGQTCRATYALPDGDAGKNAAGIYTVKGVCQ